MTKWCTADSKQQARVKLDLRMCAKWHENTICFKGMHLLCILQCKSQRLIQIPQLMLSKYRAWHTFALKLKIEIQDKALIRMTHWRPKRGIGARRKNYTPWVVIPPNEVGTIYLSINSQKINSVSCWELFIMQMYLFSPKLIAALEIEHTGWYILYNGYCSLNVWTSLYKLYT